MRPKKCIYILLSFLIIFTSVCKEEKPFRLNRSIPLETSPPELNSKDIMDIKDAFKYLIKKAEKHIYINAPYFTSRLNKDIQDALKKALRRNVHIKFLLADSAYAQQEFEATELNKYKNVEVQYINISKLGHTYYGENHAKYATFDGKYAILGSANFSYPGFNNNIEINTLITKKSLVLDLENIFKLDWKYADKNFTGFSYQPSSSGDITLLESAPHPINYAFVYDIQEKLADLLDKAEKTINLEIYAISYKREYFPFYYDLLKQAIKKGVVVKLLINENTSILNLESKKFLNMQTVLQDLKKLGVKIKKLNLFSMTGKEYSALHSKLLIIDDKYIMLGSNNWTEGALFENREIAIVSEAPSMVDPLKNKFNLDWNSSFSIPVN